MVSIGKCQRVVVEHCQILPERFLRPGRGPVQDCTVRNCDLSYNGNTGLGMGECATASSKVARCWATTTAGFIAAGTPAE